MHIQVSLLVHLISRNRSAFDNLLTKNGGTD